MEIESKEINFKVRMILDEDELEMLNHISSYNMGEIFFKHVSSRYSSNDVQKLFEKIRSAASSMVRRVNDTREVFSGRKVAAPLAGRKNESQTT
jgi:hypothetical protein